MSHVKFHVVAITILTTLLSCAYKDDNDSAQREADVIFQKSVERCNRIKGVYKGEIQTLGEPIEVEAGIFCQPGSTTSTDKEGNVIAQMIPYINLQRQDIPIPATLEIVYSDSTNTVLMKKLSNSGNGGSGNNGKSERIGGAPQGHIPLISSIKFDPVTSFNGEISGDTIRGEASAANQDGTTAPIGNMILRRDPSKQFVYSASAIAVQTEKAILKVVSKFTGLYNGCIRLSNEPKFPFNIQLELQVVNTNSPGGGSGLVLKGFFKRFDLESPGNTNEMVVSIDFLQKSQISIYLNGIAKPNSPYAPVLGGILINNKEFHEIDAKDLFEGEFSSQLGTLGEFKLIKQQGRIPDCRKMYPPK